MCFHFLYLGKSHNLWHRSTLLLEKKAFDGSFETSTGFNTTSASSMEAMDSLSEMYSLLKEEDMWAGLWQRKVRTILIILYYKDNNWQTRIFFTYVFF